MPMLLSHRCYPPYCPCKERMYFRVHTPYEYIHRTYGDATSITLNGVAIYIFFSPAAPLKMRQKHFWLGPIALLPLYSESCHCFLSLQEKRNDMTSYMDTHWTCAAALPTYNRKLLHTKQQFFFIIANYDNYTDLPSPPSCPSMETLPSSLQEPKWV